MVLGRGRSEAKRNARGRKGKANGSGASWAGKDWENPMTEADAIDRARKLLEPPPLARDPARATLGAALLAAVSAMLLAGAVILGPGFEADPGAPGAIRAFR